MSRQMRMALDPPGRQQNLLLPMICLVVLLAHHPVAFCAALSSSSSGLCHSYATGTLALPGEVQCDYHIRDAILEDLPAVSSMMIDCFPSSSRGDALAQYNFKMEHLQKLQDELQTMKQHRMLVASFLVPNSNNSNNENDVIGFVHLDHRPPPTNAYLKFCPRPIVTDLMVCSDLRRNGIARTLMEQCEHIAYSDYNADTLYLRVLDSNHAAIRFYERLGFDYCPDMRENVRPDLLLFRKPLQLSSQQQPGVPVPHQRPTTNRLPIIQPD